MTCIAMAMKKQKGGYEMTIIEFAQKRLEEEIRQNDFGADNNHDIAYWRAYLDGALEQKAEDDNGADKGAEDDN